MVSSCFARALHSKLFQRSIHFRVKSLFTVQYHPRHDANDRFPTGAEAVCVDRVCRRQMNDQRRSSNVSGLLCVIANVGMHMLAEVVANSLRVKSEWMVHNVASLCGVHKKKNTKLLPQLPDASIGFTLPTFCVCTLAPSFPDPTTWSAKRGAPSLQGAHVPTRRSRLAIREKGSR